MSNHLKKALWTSMLTISCLGLVGTIGANGQGQSASANRRSRQVYDLSQWQGRLSAHKVKGLKRETRFVILRAQDGGLYTDTQFAHNAYLMNKYHVPYGVYSYSLAKTPAQARDEARALIRRAPHARFYINDIEQDNGGYTTASTKEWGREMRSLTNRPVVLYSYKAFIDSHLLSAVPYYNTVWLADYSGEEPDAAYHYDLWQFTDNHYSQALKQSLDDSTFPSHAKPVSFWIGNHHKKVSIYAQNAQNYVNSLSFNGHKVHRHRKIHRKRHIRRQNLTNQSIKAYSSFRRGFYRSNKLHWFKVIRPDGIELYSTKTGRPIHHLKDNRHVHRLGYRYYYYPKIGLITKGVGIWHGHEVMFTMSKNSIVHY